MNPLRVGSTWLLLRRIRAESGTKGLFAGQCVGVGVGGRAGPATLTPDPGLLSSAGFLPRIIKAAPSCAIMISTYEFGKSFFQRLNQDRLLGS